MPELQQTLAKAIKCQGIGLHSGKQVELDIMPAGPDTGIVFKRIDLKNNNTIRANYSNVVDTKLCTVIANEYGVKVSTVEHVMAALWGCNIDNALIRINAEEMPIVDGSAAPFVALIRKAGLKIQNKTRAVIKVIKSVRVKIEDKFIELTPSENFNVDYNIEFSHAAIGSQSFSYSDSLHSFNYIISRARTFGFANEIDQLKKMGFALGASLTNAIGVDEKGVMNPEGLRYSDEFVRHKLLDCIGDLYLAGCRIMGKITAVKAGHLMHNLLLQKLFSSADNFVIEGPKSIKNSAVM